MDVHRLAVPKVTSPGRFALSAFSFGQEDIALAITSTAAAD